MAAVSYGDPDCVAALRHLGPGIVRERQIKALTKQPFQISVDTQTHIQFKFEFECNENVSELNCAFLWLSTRFVGSFYRLHMWI